MPLFDNLNPQRVFYYFGEICKIPHGSQNSKRIADFCEAFANKHSLKYVRDNADNLIIYKPASKGYENSEPVILQGHIDMVCQCVAHKDINFLTDPIEAYVDGDYIKANGTTLGADNGIAVAMIFAILESNEYSHPPIEAVLTTDEEIGMIGALKLDMSLLNGKKMINMDSEEDDTLTVSCAGGRDFTVCIPKNTVKKQGTAVKIKLEGFAGGHSGVEIDKGRVNGDILAGRILNHLKQRFNFDIISINGGDKSNAIVNNCIIELCVFDVNKLITYLDEYLTIIKDEISSREKDFSPVVEIGEENEYSVFSEQLKRNIIYALVCSPQGVIDMSCEIDGLVETSTNLGILKTQNDNIIMQYSFRSNKKSAIDRLEERMRALFSFVECKVETFGDYPSWSYNPNSTLQSLYKECYGEFFSNELKVSAIHAGLECGVFDFGIDGLDCISIGPNMFDVHTVNERLSISSTEKMFNVILTLLKKSK